MTQSSQMPALAPEDAGTAKTVATIYIRVSAIACLRKL